MTVHRRKTSTFTHGDKVTVGDVPGKWRIYSPHPDPGKFYLEPVDDVARELASALPYAMLVSPGKQISHRAADPLPTLGEELR